MTIQQKNQAIAFRQSYLNQPIQGGGGGIPLANIQEHALHRPTRSPVHPRKQNKTRTQMDK